MTDKPAPDTQAPAPTRPEDIQVITPGRKPDPARDADSDILVPPDSAGGR